MSHWTTKKVMERRHQEWCCSQGPLGTSEDCCCGAEPEEVQDAEDLKRQKYEALDAISELGSDEEPFQ